MSEPGSEEENGARRGKVTWSRIGICDYLKSLVEKDTEWDPAIFGLFDRCGQKGRFGGMG